jgi:hypothetical protein
MEMSVYFNVLIAGLIGAAPALVFWIAVIVFASVMLGRGGGRAERFFIAGAGIKIAASLLTIPANAIVFWLIPERPMEPSSVTSILSTYGILIDVIGMAGTICLVYAFWVKFNTMKSGREVVLSPNWKEVIHDTDPEY